MCFVLVWVFVCMCDCSCAIKLSIQHPYFVQCTWRRGCDDNIFQLDAYRKPHNNTLTSQDRLTAARDVDSCGAFFKGMEFSFVYENIICIIVDSMIIIIIICIRNENWITNH